MARPSLLHAYGMLRPICGNIRHRKRPKEERASTLSVTTTSDITIVSEFYPPIQGATSQLIDDLASHLDHHVASTHVISTVTQITTVSRTAHSICKFLRYIYNRISSKGLRALVFVIFSFLSLIASSSRGPILFVSNPPFIGIVGVLIRLLTGRRYIFLFQDVFPRSAVLAGIIPACGPQYHFWRYLIHITCLLSEETLVLSTGMYSRLLKEYPTLKNVKYVNNWAVERASVGNVQSNPFSTKWNTRDKLTVQYSGNFGELHDLIVLLEAARLLENHPIQFIFVGSGKKKSQISRYMDDYHLTNVKLYPYVDRSLLHQSLGACDLSVISLIPGADDTVSPSKLLGILASRKPVLFIGSTDSYLAELIRTYKIGFVSEPGDPLALATTLKSIQQNSELLQEMGSNSYHLYCSRFTSDHAFKTYVESLQPLLQCK